MSDIVERLRKGDTYGDCKRDRCMCDVMEEAADTITALRAEVRKMTDLYEVTRTDALRNGEDASRLTARVKELEEALSWYADPERYAAHPHGPAFDRRDISYVARAVLSASQPAPQKEGE